MSETRLKNPKTIRKTKSNTYRSPNLSTILMVEHFLKEHRDVPMKLATIRQQLPKQVMHQTLKVIFGYLWRSGKVLYGPRGIQWIYAEPAHLKKMLDDAVEV